MSPAMTVLSRFAARRPLAFVLALAVAQPLVAMPFVILFRLWGADPEALRLLIPAVQSGVMLWLVGHLGWWRRAGFVRDLRDVHLLAYPVLLAGLPLLAYGSVDIGAAGLAFYAGALLFTGISEETFARGIALPALIGAGRYRAVPITAAIFSAGHLTNAFFESFTLLEWADKFLATFGFAVLYGAVFLRTANLLPLIALHALHDMAYLISGTAGPYLVTPMDPRLHLSASIANIAAGLWLLRKVRAERFMG